ncbi:MAG: ATP-binding cassette domain-containing protein [Lachnospiraceae bacterium]
MEQKEVLLEVKNLEVAFGSGKHKFLAVNDVSFKIYKGETFGVVGESGSGKTTIGRAIMRIHPTSKGDIFFKGEKINGSISKELDHRMTQEVQMIFQDPMASLNERAKVSYIVSEGLMNIEKMSDNERHQRVEKSLKEVGLLPEFASRFPHEFSGGQRQRIGIARALIMEPEFIIADEPISALDVSIRSQVLNLLDKLQKEKGLTYLFIAHDLSVMRFITDRIAVIHEGVIVELADTKELFEHPLHPYTKALLSAIPLPNPLLEKEKTLLTYNKEMHDYGTDRPTWHQIREHHYVRANEAERRKYEEEYEGYSE